MASDQQSINGLVKARWLIVLAALLLITSCGKDVFVNNEGTKYGYFQNVQYGNCQLVSLDLPHIHESVRKGLALRISQKEFAACRSAMELKDSIENAANEARRARRAADEAADEARNAADEARNAERRRQLDNLLK